MPRTIQQRVSFRASPMHVEDAVRVELEAIAWRDGLKRS